MMIFASCVCFSLSTEHHTDRSYFNLVVPACFVHVQVHGTSAGGDADELRLLSTSDTFINLRAHGGSLDFLRTKVRRTL